LAEGAEPPGLWSGGAFFPLEPALEPRRRLREALELGRRRSPVCSPATSARPARADGRRPATPAAVLVPVVDRPEPT
jgi:hypothetical protein